jgi:hypothetical protein
MLSTSISQLKIALLIEKRFLANKISLNNLLNIKKLGINFYCSVIDFSRHISLALVGIIILFLINDVILLISLEHLLY